MRVLFDFLSRNKRHVATFALIFGFVVDIITFRNIDLSLSQLILSVHLLIVALSILILSTPQKERGGLIGFTRSWLPVLLQYSTGNLLSAFLVLYSGSGSLAQSWPFFALVAVAAIGNETLKLDTYLLPFRTTLLFLNLLLFSVLAVPIAVHSISAWSFLVSIAIATTIFSIYAYLGGFFLKSSFRRHFKKIERSALATLVIFAMLYFTNLIPPIPLSVKTIDFYHNVYKTDNTYIGVDEERPFWERFFALSGVTLNVPEGSDAYVFTAIFAPAKLETTVAHVWEHYDESAHAWVTVNTVPFPIVGGRAEGYRGYSLVSNPKPGKWRVTAKTARGQVIGRAYLIVVQSTEENIYNERIID